MKKFLTVAFMASALVVAACGGGGGGSGGGTTPPPPVTGTVSGTAVKGPVNGGTMTAYALSNGAMGAKIASATSAVLSRITPPLRGGQEHVEARSFARL